MLSASIRKVGGEGVLSASGPIRKAQEGGGGGGLLSASIRNALTMVVLHAFKGEDVA